MNNNFNNFNNMDDLFNQLMGGMRGYSSENRRYLINGREVTPEEFAHYRATGQLPGNAESDATNATTRFRYETRRCPLLN